MSDGEVGRRAVGAEHDAVLVVAEVGRSASHVAPSRSKAWPPASTCSQAVATIPLACRSASFVNTSMCTRKRSSVALMAANMRGTPARAHVSASASGSTPSSRASSTTSSPG